MLKFKKKSSCLYSSPTNFGMRNSVVTFIFASLLPKPVFLWKFKFLELVDSYCQTDFRNGFPDPELVENEYRHGPSISNQNGGNRRQKTAHSPCSHVALASSACADYSNASPRSLSRSIRLVWRAKKKQTVRGRAGGGKRFHGVGSLWPHSAFPF